MQNRARALNEERPALRKTRGPRVTPRSCNRRVFAYITRQRLSGLGPAPWWRWTGSHLPPALGMRGTYRHPRRPSSPEPKKNRAFARPAFRLRNRPSDPRTTQYSQALKGKTANNVALVHANRDNAPHGLRRALPFPVDETRKTGWSRKPSGNLLRGTGAETATRFPLSRSRRFHSSPCP